MIMSSTDPSVFPEIKKNFEKGKAAVLPCDTIYGLCSAYPGGRAELIKIKKRNEGKQFIVLAAAEQLKSICRDVPAVLYDIWPAPLTAVLNSTGGGTIAVRVPADSFISGLLDYLKTPVYSTSVNISGQASLVDFESICREFGNSVDLFVKGESVCQPVPSTIADFTCSPFRLIRQGLFDINKKLSELGFPMEKDE